MPKANFVDLAGSVAGSVAGFVGSAGLDCFARFVAVAVVAAEPAVAYDVHRQGCSGCRRSSGSV